MPQGSPNVVVYISDSCRADAVNGSGLLTEVMPNVNRLARRGCRFNRAYTVTAQCAPARASLMSALYPSQHQVRANGIHMDPTLSAGHWFRPDFDTSYIGHWHLGRERERYGFDHNVYVRGGTDCAVEEDEYRQSLAEQGCDLTDFPFCRDTTRFIGGAGPSRLKPEQFFGSFVADLAIEQLHRFAERRQPFLMIISDFAPHSPFAVPPPYDRMFDPDHIDLPANCRAEPRFSPEFQAAWRQKIQANFDLSEAHLRRIWAHYLGLCRLVDDNFGRVQGALDQLGLIDTTDLVFLSDHGDLLGSHGLVLKGPGFYEEQMRVPLTMAGPGIPAGRVVDEAVSLIDVFPTLAGLAGVSAPADREGRDLSPLWHPSPTWDRPAIFAEHPSQNGNGSLRAAFTSRWKYHRLSEGRDELFDLHLDPGEMENRIEHPDSRETLEHLRGQMARWLTVDG